MLGSERSKDPEKSMNEAFATLIRPFREGLLRQTHFEADKDLSCTKSFFAFLLGRAGMLEEDFHTPFSFAIPPLIPRYLAKTPVYVVSDSSCTLYAQSGGKTDGMPELRALLGHSEAYLVKQDGGGALDLTKKAGQVWKDLGKAWAHMVVVYQFNDLFEGTTPRHFAPPDHRDNVKKLIDSVLEGAQCRPVTFVLGSDGSRWGARSIVWDAEVDFAWKYAKQRGHGLCLVRTGEAYFINLQMVGKKGKAGMEMPVMKTARGNRSISLTL